MKKLVQNISVIVIFFTNTLSAQDFKTPTGYLEILGNEFKAIQNLSWEYTKSVANNKSARKTSKRRIELIQQINSSTKNVSRMPSFENKSYLKDSVLAYLRIQKIVLEEDYSKIMDLEDVSESSYDAMEAYFKAREIANKKMETSSERVMETYNNFVKEYNIHLINGNDDKVTKNLKIAEEVYEHHNLLYLTFFKAYKQELYLLEALNKNDLAALEQNKVSLTKISIECLEKLKSIKSFRGVDDSMINSLKVLLLFYKDESEVKFIKLVDFISKKEAFEKAYKAFQSNNTKSSVQIDEYNKLIEDFNKSSIEYNNINSELNKSRASALNEWTKTAQIFTAKYL